MADVYDALDARFRSWVDEIGFSGIASVRRGGLVEWEGCYGLADRAAGVAVHPGTRFGLASLSKMFTAVAVTTLVRDGRLAFDTPVAGVLPPERRPATLRADVTVAHLLSHTAGIADYFEEEDEPEGGYAGLWAHRPVASMLRPADFLPLFGDLEPYRPPGGRWHYSNAGYVLLALVVEELTGQEFPAAVAERVFGPAGMAASGYFRSDDGWPDVAPGWSPPAAAGLPWRSNVHEIPVLGGGDGGAHTTAADLDRFLRAYEDGTLVGPALRDEMLTPRRSVDPGIDFGYGAFLYGAGRFGHGGGDPGVATIAQRVPAAGVSVSVLCNADVPVVEARNLLLAAAGV